MLGARLVLRLSGRRHEVERQMADGPERRRGALVVILFGGLSLPIVFQGYKRWRNEQTVRVLDRMRGVYLRDPL